jgi:hypothetical protein
VGKGGNKGLPCWQLLTNIKKDGRMSRVLGNKTFRRDQKRNLECSEQDIFVQFNEQLRNHTSGISPKMRRQAD